MSDSNSAPRLYHELADWFHVLTPPEDYAEEAAIYRATLLQASTTPPRTLLELGSGGGNNASFLKHDFTLTLVDVSPQMLAVSQSINPECEHFQGDMRTVRLNREFDAVFIHDALCYMTTLEDLRQALLTAYVHCRPGGVALFVPDFTQETFQPGTDHGGSDRGDRALRYLDWIWDPDPADNQYTVDYAYMLRDAQGHVTVEHDRHHEGLFARSQWLELLHAVGFTAHAQPFEHSEVKEGAELFVGLK